MTTPGTVGRIWGTLSELSLRALLDRDRETTGVVPSTQKNKISRSHYAQLLGCAPTALARFNGIFAEYERELGITTGPLRRLNEMRAWLSTSYKSGELGIYDGKADRRAFQRYFGLSGGTFITRYAPIRALFEEIDARIEREGYLPITRREELARVVEALAGEVSVNRDRLTINLVDLAKAANVPRTRFVDKLFADLVTVRQAEIATKAAANRIDPFVHGRVFVFSDLAPPWSNAFLERVSTRFGQIASGFAVGAAKQPYLQLFNALEWIGASANPHCVAVVDSAAASGRVLAPDDWEEALFAYRSHLLEGIANGTATDAKVDTAISHLRRMIEPLSSGGVVPATSTPLPGVKYKRWKAMHLRSVAEAPQADFSNEKQDYVEFAISRYREACKAHGSGIGEGDSQEFINGLALEFRSARELPSDPVKAVLAVLDHRLGALRDHAKAIVSNAIDAHDVGRELLAMSKIDAAEFEQNYLGSALTLNQRKQLVRSLFPKPDESSQDQVKQGAANLLELIDRQHSGIPPVGNGAKGGLYGQFFAKRYLAYGGLGTIQRMLIPDLDTVCAVLTLYLCESGSNVSVGRTLNRDCVEPSDLEEYRRVTGYKARARGRPIIIDLPCDSPAVQAMGWLQKAGSRLCAAAGKDGDRLFLMRIGGSVQMITPHSFTGWFKNFAASIPDLKGVYLVPNMIRPSVLLRAALANDGRLATGMAIGQHGVAVTQGYQQKWPTRLLYDDNISRFQKAFETLVMSGIQDAAAHLGITAEEFEQRLGDLRATGLGTFCANQRGHPGEEGSICSTLDCWNDCPQLVIVAEIEAIAALQLWQASLRVEQPNWERDRPERWDGIWLPWLCLTDVVEEKMARGPMLKIWLAARKRAATISAQPGFVPPKPW